MNYQIKLKNKIKKFANSNWMVAIILFIATFSIVFPLLINGRSFIVNMDAVDQTYSWYQKMSHDIHIGILPIWNNSQFSGQSFAGDLQPGVFYPLNIIFVGFFGNINGVSEFAINLFISLHFFIGSLVAYFFIRELGASKKASLLAGLLYVLSGPVASRASGQAVLFIGYALMLLPAYFLIKFNKSRSKKYGYIVFSGISLGLIVLSGHVDSVYFSLLLLVFIEINLLFTDKKYLLSIKKAREALGYSLSIIIIVITAIITALPQLIISTQYLPKAYRWQLNGYTPSGEKISYSDFSSAFNADPHSLLNFINPWYYPVKDGNNFFVGLLPLFIIIVAILFFYKKNKMNDIKKNYLLLIVLLCGFGYFASLGYWTLLGVVLYNIPLVSQIREPARYIVLLHVGIVIAFAYSYDLVNEYNIPKKYISIMYLTALSLIFESIYIFIFRAMPGFGINLSIQLLIAGVGIVFMTLAPDEKRMRIALSLLVLVAMFSNALWFIPKYSQSNYNTERYKVSPKTIDLLKGSSGMYRVLTEDNVLPINSGNVYDFQSVGGYGATVYAPYYELQLDRPIVFHTTSSLPESLNIKKLNSQLVSKNLLNDLLGVKYLLNSSDKNDYGYSLLQREDNINIYENKSALSKIFYSKKEGSLNREDYENLNVKKIEYNDRIQKYIVNSPVSRMVIISEIQYPGWVLRIDGRNEPWKPYCLAGLPIFREFYLSGGSHEIEFIYKPFIAY